MKKKKIPMRIKDERRVYLTIADTESGSTKSRPIGVQIHSMSKGYFKIHVGVPGFREPVLSMIIEEHELDSLKTNLEYMFPTDHISEMLTDKDLEEIYKETSIDERGLL